MKLNVQNFLIGAGLQDGPDGIVNPGPNPLIGLEQLTAVLGIVVKQHPVYSELYQLSYDQLESPKGHPIVRECRGIILNSADNWAVVAYPFNRFANSGENWAEEIDWNSVRVQEKVDGSLLFCWYFKGKWNVSTRGLPAANGLVGDYSFTFAELFWKTVEKYHLNVSDLNSDLTYMFELTSLFNRVVCVYGKDSALTLIGARNISVENYPEIVVSQVQISDIPVVKEYYLSSVKEIEAAALELDPIRNEGFVVVDKNFNRIKMKSPSYVVLHHLKEGFGQRRIIRLLQLGEKSEILSYFPEYLEMFEDIELKIDDMISQLEDEWNAIKHLSDRKTFALQAVKSKNSGVLFALFLGKATDIREYILYSKKVVGGSSEDFAFTAVKIEEMLGLKSNPEIIIEA